jgi:HEAT repeat protein
VDGEEWAKAVAKFSQFVASYPKDKDVDVALYWLAYALKRQGKPREASEQLARLLREHPRSAWAEEATAMLTELAPQTGDRKMIDEGLGQNDEEIRIVALQSLFEANPERAMAYVADLLKPGSNASRSFKESAVSILGNHGGRAAVPILFDIARNQPDRELRIVAIRKLTDAGEESVVEQLVALYDAERDAEIKASILRSFESVRDARADAKLLAVARGAGEPLELRQTAIRILGQKESAAAFDALAQIYESDTNRDIREQIIRSLADMEDPRARARLVEMARGVGAADAGLRQYAIRRLADRGGEATVDELVRLYGSEQDREVRQTILRALADTNHPRARARLAAAARAETDAELRKQAIRALADSDESLAVETMLAMYDAETEFEFKQHILRTLADTKDKRALRKLLDVARRDPNPELRKQAIRLLGQSDDPEAMKFLEEILRP